MTAAAASPRTPRALAAKMRRRAPLRGFWRAAPCKQARARIHPRTRSARVNTSRGKPVPRERYNPHIEGNRNRPEYTLFLPSDCPRKWDHLKHLAGNGQFGYEGDGGDARAAKLAGPKGIALSGDDIYIADTESHTVRRINRATGRIDTVLGDGANHDGPDGDPLRCGLARPHGVYVASDGRVFVGDTDNHRVRVLGT